MNKFYQFIDLITIFTSKKFRNDRYYYNDTHYSCGLMTCLHCAKLLYSFTLTTNIGACFVYVPN